MNKSLKPWCMIILALVLISCSPSQSTTTNKTLVNNKHIFVIEVDNRVISSNIDVRSMAIIYTMYTSSLDTEMRIVPIPAKVQFNGLENLVVVFKQVIR